VVWLVGLSNAFNLVTSWTVWRAGCGDRGNLPAAVALLNGRLVVAAFTVALIGALLGFLRFNFARPGSTWATAGACSWD